ncbi:MAG: helix-turn-helix transcriptional regulator [Phycisphaeraceae bacterium]
MGRSQRLRLGDVRAVHQLIGQCSELWSDAHAWREHLVQGLRTLVNGRTGFMVLSDGDPMTVCCGTPLIACGWDTGEDEARFRDSLAVPLGEIVPEAEPVFADLETRRFISVSIHELVSVERWHRSEGYNRYHRPSNTDGLVASARVSGPGRVEFLGACRAVGEAPFGRRELKINALLHREVAGLIGTRLATEQQLGRHGLSPRLRMILDYLLDGLTEKQIAQLLHRSPATVHRHVTMLYRHFNVTSRGELLSYFVHRKPRDGVAMNP